MPPIPTDIINILFEVIPLRKNMSLLSSLSDIFIGLTFIILLHRFLLFVSISNICPLTINFCPGSASFIILIRLPSICPVSVEFSIPSFPILSTRNFVNDFLIVCFFVVLIYHENFWLFTCQSMLV